MNITVDQLVQSAKAASEVVASRKTDDVEIQALVRSLLAGLGLCFENDASCIRVFRPDGKETLEVQVDSREEREVPGIELMVHPSDLASSSWSYLISGLSIEGSLTKFAEWLGRNGYVGHLLEKES